MKKEIKHIFFDLDHTLWDFEKNSALTFKKIFQLNHININLDEFLDVYVPLNLKYWRLFREGKISKENLRYERLKVAFDTLSFKVADPLIHQLSIDYITYLSTFNYVFDGAIDLLNYLSNKYHLHIITNGFQEVQDKKMKGANLFHYFKTVTNSEIADVKKPNPKIFYFALNIAKANAAESLMIGDSLEADILGAQRVNMKTILFDPTNLHPEYHHLKVSNLNSIKKLL